MKNYLLTTAVMILGSLSFDAFAVPDCNVAGPHYFAGGLYGDAYTYAETKCVSKGVTVQVTPSYGYWSSQFISEDGSQWVPSYAYWNAPTSIPGYIAEEWEIVNGEYLPIPAPSCDLPAVWNDQLESCENCASGQWDGLSGACLDIVDTCAGMATLDQTTNMVTSCETLSCGNITGSLLYDPTFSFCQAYADSCESQGGTYGAVGGSTATGHVCLTASSMPECSAVSVFDGGAGIYGAACTAKTVPNNICDTTKYDCDGDGAIDDQNLDGCLDNGISNGTCVGTTTGTGSPTIPATNIGDTPFATATSGAGQCDPTSKNYAQCSGQGPDVAGNEATNLILEGIQTTNQAIRDDLNTATDSDFFTDADGDDIGDAFVLRLSQVPIVAAIAQNEVFSGTASCPAPEFTAFGQIFAINSHCTLFDSFANLISLLMITIYSIAGARHILSA